MNDPAGPSGLIPGTVVTIASVACRVDTEGGSCQCTARGRLTESDTAADKPLVVGDRVLVQATGPGEGVIVEVLPRRTRLSRTLPHEPHVEHVVAANVDQLLIVSSVREPRFTVGIIDRYIIAATDGGLTPLVCINKTDLAGGPADYEGTAAMYRDVGYPVFLTSVEAGRGIGELREALRDKCTVLAGHSGVGKSSLLNAVQPGLRLKTAPLGWKGTHCTSTVMLMKLDFGGYVVDTPGVRELHPWDVSRRDVAGFFPDLWRFATDCRMPACLHVQEPDCGVRAALERGELNPVRYESYLSILDSIQELQEPRRTDVVAPRRQVSRKQRRPSRRVEKQRRQRKWQEDLDGNDETRNPNDDRNQKLE